MENGLIIGYDLTKDYCRISYYAEGEEEPKDVIFSDGPIPSVIQNSICKKKGADEWLVGPEAYETALLGGGSIVDKLLLLIARKGFSTFEGIRYSAEDLFYHYLDETLKILYNTVGKKEISALVFSVQELDSVVLDTIMNTCKRLEINRKTVHIISHTECFLYYGISRKRDLWSNMSVLYDFSGDGLNYYELEVLRGMQPNAAQAKRFFLEDGFSIDILESEKGHKMADSIMTSCVERTLAKKLVSSCYLSGNGMNNCRVWGDRFLKTLCKRRKVFFVENLFAKGAVYAAMEYLRTESAYPFRIMCEGRTRADIRMEVVKGLARQTVVMAESGNNWYETKSEFDIIPDQESSLSIQVHKFGDRNSATYSVSFNELTEKRGNRLTRLGVSLKFTSENTFMITLKDKGFGEFFPASGNTIFRTFSIK